MFSPLLLIKPIIMAGLGTWLGIACFNNVVDRSTNRHLLGSMIGMDLLKEEEILGKGLINRAWIDKKRAHTILWTVVIVQAIITAGFWLSAILLTFSTFNQHFINLALLIANGSLLSFMCLWIWFMCGGLWFGYWIKMSQVQTTHLLLLIIGLLATLVINMH